MNNNQFIRSEMLFGKESTNILNSKKVAIFGIGGVGSYTVEALSRGGIGTFYLFDKDVVSLSNINRQLVASHSTIGYSKVEVAKRRILDINPNANVFVYEMFVGKDTINSIDFQQFDYIVDAVDTITAKILLIEEANKYNIPIISSMGAGNKFDPTKFEVTDIFKTSVCPLARVMRNELKKRKIKSLKVVYSKEVPVKPIQFEVDEIINNIKRETPGSLSFVPSVCGLIIAGEVIKDLLK